METSGRSFQSLLKGWAAAVEGTSLPQPPAFDRPDVLLARFVEHSDQVRPGDCFVARVRTGSDGHPYIGAAVEKGASLIVGQLPRKEVAEGLASTPYVRVEDSALALAWLSAAWHGFPSSQLVVIGVTGTDGKTTTANLLFEVLRAAGLESGLLSTVRAVIGTDEEPLALHVTTPEAPVVQEYLRRMVDAGLTHCILEATSHGLAQHRVGAVEFDVAVITNITHEHLDYHGDYEAYFQAKSRLITALSESKSGVASGNRYKMALAKTAVLNVDDLSYERLAAIAGEEHIAYGLEKPAEMSAKEIRYEGDHTQFQLLFNIGRDVAAARAAQARAGMPPVDGIALPVVASLPGRFNVYNMLAAAAAGRALGLKPEQIRRGLQAVRLLDGRMERIDSGQPFEVVVDFAHTPNALEQAIRAGRRMAAGRIITVFGSAGKRDVAKRRLMAERSARLADLTVLTAEDPRTESLDDILEEMAEGCREQGALEGESFWRVPDRGQAIHFALTLARPDDLVLVCGKGHEQSMCFGATEFPWDDRLATRVALDAYLAGEPMPDLGLPTYVEYGE